MYWIITKSQIFTLLLCEKKFMKPSDAVVFWPRTNRAVIERLAATISNSTRAMPHFSN